jgi:hypothetical protein
MRQLHEYRHFSLPASNLFVALREEVGLSELEAATVLELKLKLSLDTVMGIIAWTADQKGFVPGDRIINFEHFCIHALPGERPQLTQHNPCVTQRKEQPCA